MIPLLNLKMCSAELSYLINIIFISYVVKCRIESV